MDYQRIYNQLITNAKDANRTRRDVMLYERHHIVPRSRGGTDCASNLVFLTIREHFVAHRLLVKIYPNCKKMVYALWWMSKTSRTKGVRVSGRVYETARLLFSLHNPQKDEANKARFRARRAIPGYYKYDNKKTGRSLSATLSKLTPDQMKARMAAARSADQREKGKAIQRTKSSRLEMLDKTTGNVVEFLSYESEAVTGYAYGKIQYHAKKTGGLLPNGNQVRYIVQYNVDSKEVKPWK